MLGFVSFFMMSISRKTSSRAVVNEKPLLKLPPFDELLLESVLLLKLLYFLRYGLKKTLAAY
jgi:hypothetical protein